MEKLRQNCQNCILLHQRNIVREFFLKKNLHFHNFLRASGENFSKRFSKLHSNIPEEHCWRTFLLKKTNNLMILVSFGVKTYWQDSTLSEPPLKRNCLFAKKYRFIKFLRASGQKFAARLSKLQSSFPEEHFWRKLFLEKNYEFIILFRSPGEKFLTGLSELHSKFSNELLWRTILFE